jgi:hypothetical protein
MFAAVLDTEVHKCEAGNIFRSFAGSKNVSCTPYHPFLNTDLYLGYIPAGFLLSRCLRTVTTYLAVDGELYTHLSLVHRLERRLGQVVG